LSGSISTGFCLVATLLNGCPSSSLSLSSESDSLLSESDAIAQLIGFCFRGVFTAGVDLGSEAEVGCEEGNLTDELERGIV